MQKSHDGRHVGWKTGAIFENRLTENDMINDDFQRPRNEQQSERVLKRNKTQLGRDSRFEVAEVTYQPSEDANRRPSRNARFRG